MWEEAGVPTETCAGMGRTPKLHPDGGPSGNRLFFPINVMMERWNETCYLRLCCVWSYLWGLLSVMPFPGLPKGHGRLPPSLHLALEIEVALVIVDYILGEDGF